MESETELASWGLDRVRVSTRSSTGRGQTIYVQDTGIRSSHSDFGGRSSPAIDLTSGSVVECSSGSSDCAQDRQGHGTHCAGTAAGTTFGVATKANVYGVKVLGDSGAGSFDAIVGGIDFAAASSARPAVGSMSLGGQCPFGLCSLFGIVT